MTVRRETPEKNGCPVTQSLFPFCVSRTLNGPIPTNAKLKTRSDDNAAMYIANFHFTPNMGAHKGPDMLAAREFDFIWLASMALIVETLKTLNP
jgi:hypothetical protein